MGVNLQKGQRVNLSKDNHPLTEVYVGLGWDEAPHKFDQPDIDCDASALLLRNGKLTDFTDVVYYGNLQHRSGAVKHTGDNLTGAGEGDDEVIRVNLSAVPGDVDRIVFVVNIYACEHRKQDFGLIRNAFIRICDTKGTEILRYNLSEDYKGMTAMIFGEMYRHNGEWKFNAIGQPTHDTSLTKLCEAYG